MLKDDAIAADLLPILKDLRVQREREASAGTVVRERVSLDLIHQLVMSPEEDREARLRLREIVRDTVESVDVTRVQVSKNQWYSMIDAVVRLTDGGEMDLRFATARAASAGSSARGRCTTTPLRMGSRRRGTQSRRRRS